MKVIVGPPGGVTVTFSIPSSCTEGLPMEWIEMFAQSLEECAKCDDLYGSAACAIRDRIYSSAYEHGISKEQGVRFIEEVQKSFEDEIAKRSTARTVPVSHATQVEVTSPEVAPLVTEDVPQPPRLLEGLLCLFTPREKQDELKGQLTEAYAEWLEEYGERWANVLYAKEIACSFGPVLERTAEWFAKYKVMHYLGEIIGRFSQH